MVADRRIVEEVFLFLRDNKPAEWDRLRGMSPDEYERVLRNWTSTLGPIPDEILMEVTVMACRKPGAFMPPPGDLYNAALDLMDDSPDVGEAWALVLRKARGGNPDLPRRAAKAVAMIGGTDGWLEKDIPYRRQEFAKAYERAGREWRERMALPGAELKMLAERSGS